MRQRNGPGGFNASVPDDTEGRDEGRRDGATVAGFGDRGMRGGKAGWARVFVQGVAREF